MLSKATAGEWDDFAKMEVNRRERLEAFFKHSFTSVQTPQLTKTVQTLLELEQKLLALSEQEQERTKIHLHALKQGRKANSAYK